MSLTKQDIQQIGQIIEEKLESKLEEKLESKLEEKLESKLDAKLESKLEEKLESKLDAKLESKLEGKFESKLAPIKKSLKKIEQKLDLTIRTFDRDFNYHHRRLTKLEDAVGIKPPPVTSN